MTRHQQTHIGCPHLTKALCVQAEHDLLGKCSEMTADQQKPSQCSRWAVVLYKDKAACAQHYEGMVDRERTAEIRASKAAELKSRIDAYIAWRKVHPSIWDNPPKGPDGRIEYRGVTL